MQSGNTGEDGGTGTLHSHPHSQGGRSQSTHSSGLTSVLGRRWVAGTDGAATQTTGSQQESPSTQQNAFGVCISW
jgi:hypothetical protein